MYNVDKIIENVIVSNYENPFVCKKKKKEKHTHKNIALRMLNFLNNERNKVSFKRRLQGEEND